MKVGLISRVSVAVFAVTFGLAPAALAQAPAKSGTTVTTADYTETRVGGDQVVTFPDDGLLLGKDGPTGFTIRRGPGVLRMGLIRPRVNFVSELLKSVENL